MNDIVGILLAAGSAERFGSNKLLTELPTGEPLGWRSARNLVQVVPDAVAVIRPGDHALAQLLARAGLDVVENPDATSGMGASIGAGVSARADARGWLVALADMPWVLPSTIRAVADALREGASLVAPAFGGQRGHPVGFSAQWRSRLLSLGGDSGARDLLEDAGLDLRLLPTADAGVLADVDLPSDLALP